MVFISKLNVSKPLSSALGETEILKDPVQIVTSVAMVTQKAFFILLLPYYCCTENTL
jgi:hypothetical protein